MRRRAAGQSIASFGQHRVRILSDSEQRRELKMAFFLCRAGYIREDLWTGKKLLVIVFSLDIKVKGEENRRRVRFAFAFTSASGLEGEQA